MINYKTITLFIEYYIINLPCYLLHELSHWLFAIPLYIIGLISFPKLTVYRWPSWKEVDNNTGYNIDTVFMGIRFTHLVDNYWISRYVAIAPVFMTLFLFIISPLYLKIYFFTQIDTLWLSRGDYNKFNNK